MRNNVQSTQKTCILAASAVNIERVQLWILIDTIKQLSLRAGKLKDQVSTEEATKMSLIIPFFQALGYDVFNPHEFTPEFTADVGIKKGEKVDYAIMLDGKPAILIEAKSCNTVLDKHDSQLFRYFATTSAKFGILTNGLIFKFYTDLEESNKMDLAPFIEFDILNIKDNLIPEIKKFHKDVFNVESMSSAASELKYSKLIKGYFSEQLNNPSDDFVRLFTAHAYEGMKTQAIIDKFRPLIKKTLNDYISELMNDRIISALKTDAEKQSPIEAEDSAQNSSSETSLTKESNIVTTNDELQAFYIIKSMLYGKIPIEKLSYKDTESYFGILFDNNIRKWICRIDFSGNKIKLYIPNETKDIIKYDLEKLDSLYGLTEQLVASATRYVKP